MVMLDMLLKLNDKLLHFLACLVITLTEFTRCQRDGKACKKMQQLVVNS